MSFVAFCVVAAVSWTAVTLYFEEEKPTWLFYAPVGGLAYFAAEVTSARVVALLSAAAVSCVGVYLWRTQPSAAWRKFRRVAFVACVGLLAAALSVWVSVVAAVYSLIYGRVAGVNRPADKFVAGVGGLSAGVTAATLFLLPAQQLPESGEYFTPANFTGQRDVDITCDGLMPDRCRSYAARAEALKDEYQADPVAFAGRFGGEPSDEQCLSKVLEVYRQRWDEKANVSAARLLIGIGGAQGAALGSNLGAADGVHDLFSGAVVQAPCLTTAE